MEEDIYYEARSQLEQYLTNSNAEVRENAKDRIEAIIYTVLSDDLNHNVRLKKAEGTFEKIIEMFGNFPDSGITKINAFSNILLLLDGERKVSKLALLEERETCTMIAKEIKTTKVFLLEHLKELELKRDNTERLWQAYNFPMIINEDGIRAEYRGGRFLRKSILKGKAFLSSLDEDHRVVEKRLTSVRTDLQRKGEQWHASSNDTFYYLLSIMKRAKVSLEKSAELVAAILLVSDLRGINYYKEKARLKYFKKKPRKQRLLQERQINEGDVIQWLVWDIQNIYKRERKRDPKRWRRIVGIDWDLPVPP